MHQALEGYEATCDFVNVPSALETFAELARASGDPERAAQFLGAAAERRDRLGMVIAPVHLPHRERLLDGLRRTLGAPAFDAAFAAGRQCTIESMLASPIARQ